MINRDSDKAFKLFSSKGVCIRTRFWHFAPETGINKFRHKLSHLIVEL